MSSVRWLFECNSGRDARFFVCICGAGRSLARIQHNWQLPSKDNLPPECNRLSVASGWRKARLFDAFKGCVIQ
jgi:hypothetical protein